MRIRASRISASIAKAILRGYRLRKQTPGVIKSILVFFAFFKLYLARYRPADFLTLRHDAWELDEDEYLDSFKEPSRDATTTRRKAKCPESELVPVGDLGYSGSTFFTTADSRFLVKSLPRRFEHEFFTHDLFEPYVAHMKSCPQSLLVRITDMVYTPRPTLGGILGTAPTHHIIMENLLYGRGNDDKWETYDLKPNDYFFPERDIANGKLVPDSVKDKLIDEFPDQVRVTAKQKQELLDQLGADTQLLADNKAVDYSLFLVRYPVPNANVEARTGARAKANPWRNGVGDVDDKWTYRAVVLDFFWAKSKLRARAMTRLVKTFNKVAHKGPMSITADPNEYRERFMKMVDEIVVAE